MKKPVDDPPKTWCGTCGRKFYGFGTDCPSCRERAESRLRERDAATDSVPAGDRSRDRREAGRVERRS
jgi:hypothetical protein